MVTAGLTLSVTQRAMVWLATHAVNAAKQATELMFSAAADSATAGR